MRWSWRRRAVVAQVVVVASLVMSGCTLPHSKGLDNLSKRGATVTSADSLLTRFGRLRAAAGADLDSGALTDLESGPLLRIDESAFVIRRQLSIVARPFVLDGAAAVWSPRFDSYPIWFVALAPLPQQGEQVAGVFTRAATTEPWLLTVAPRLAGDTDVPDLATADDGTVARLIGDDRPRWSDGAPIELTDTPQAVADDYARVLTSPRSPHADEFVEDSFISQMRDIREAQPGGGVTFSQTWAARPVRYVLRLDDGGALMFLTLERTDAFKVRKGNALTFDGSEAGAYLTDKIRRKARLCYEHQVLMVVPAEGEPLVIGQYGGLVTASGH